MKIVLDTETTGLDKMTNAILQLAIIDDNGNELFNQMFRPEEKHFKQKGLQYDWGQASEINNIYPSDVENCEPIETYKEEIQKILDSADEILGYNVKVDLGFLRANGFKIKKDTVITDVMKEYSDYVGDKKRFKLSHVCEQFKYKYDAHDSLNDVKATLVVHQIIAKKLKFRKKMQIGCLVELAIFAFIIFLIIIK